MSPQGEPDPADAGAQRGPYRVGMRTRHLSVSVAVYQDGSYHLSYVERIYDMGRLVGRRVLAKRVADRWTVGDRVHEAIEAMVDSELARRETEQLTGREDQGDALEEPEH